MAGEEKDYALSLEYYAAALEIFEEYRNDDNLKITIGNLAILSKTWGAAKASETIRRLNVKQETKENLTALLNEAAK